jgi:hypothetical protein
VWKTVKFEVTRGEEVRFEVVNRPGWLTYPMLLTLGAGALFLTVSRIS